MIEYEMLALRADLAAINARVKGMAYANEHRLRHDQALAFTEQDFFEAEAELLVISKKFRALFVKEKEGETNDSH